MIFVIVILVLLAILFGILWRWGYVVNDTCLFKGEIRMWVGGFLCIFNTLMTIAALLCCFRWQIGTDIKTGYIYSVEEEFGHGKVHIRLSENAGADSQEPFCVNGENLQKARELAGSGKKVKVTVPATGFRFENDFFACTSDPIIEVENDAHKQGE